MQGAPCRDCPAKGCGAYHSECSKYLEWKSNWDETRKKAQRQKHIECSTSKIVRDLYY